MADCRYCGQRVWWVKNNRTGKPMPLDPRANAGGNVYLLSRNQRADRLNYNDTGALCQVLRDVEFLDTETYPASQRYTSHFATCPKAAEAKAASAARKAEKAAKDAADQAAIRATLVDGPVVEAPAEQLALFAADKVKP